MILDLGNQPAANNLHKKNEIVKKAPLKLVVCNQCKTAQLSSTINPKYLFSKYLWVTGTSKGAKSYSKKFYNYCKKRIKANKFKVFEIACNDGTFLKPFEEYNFDTWKDILEGNLSSMFLTTKAVGKIMKKQNFGNIIQTASIYGVIPPDKNIYKNSFYNGFEISSPASYSVSKNGVIGLTKYLASHWGEYNIRVNSISPGGIFSGQNQEFVKNYSSRVPLGRMAKEEDIIGTAVFLCSDASSYITGQNIIIDGGFTL